MDMKLYPFDQIKGQPLTKNIVHLADSAKNEDVSN